MKVLRKRIAPVLMGVGLWLVGNWIMTPHPARGQDMEISGNFPTCRTYTTFKYNQLCPDAPPCTGDYEYVVYTPKHCDPRVPSNLPCNPETADAWGYKHHAYCHKVPYPGGGTYYCTPGDDIYAEDTTVQNAPFCNNGTNISLR